MGALSLVQQVKNKVLPPISSEELEEKRKKYWERIDAQVYNRNTGEKLLPFQREGVDWLGLHPRGILADEMGLGKGGVSTERVLTPVGWKTYADLVVGDLVIGSNGLTTRITGVYPRGTLPVYRVTFTDGASVRVDGDHLWLVNSSLRKCQGLKPRVLSTRDIASAPLKNSSGNWKHFIPMVKPIEFHEETKLPLDPYVLGVLLGDGALSQKTISFSGADRDLVFDVQTRIEDEVRFAGNYSYNIVAVPMRRSNRTKESLVSLNLMGKKSHTKFIPDVYKFASVESRLLLLQGLLDTDGHTRPKDGNIEYTSVSKRLAEDVQFLVESLGGTARIREKVTKRRLAYRMSVRFSGDIVPFRLARKADAYMPKTKYQPARAIVSVTPEGEEDVVCIAVEAADHLYVTERCIVTHNTVQALASVVGADALPCLFITQATLRQTMARQVAMWTGMSSYVMDSGNRGLSIRQQKSLPRDFYICHYEGVRAEYLNLKDIEWKSIIVDEATNIKNRQAQRTKAVKSLRAPRITLLSGTPLLNSPLDLWSLLNYLNPGKYSSYWAFEKRYALMGGWQNKQVMGYKNVPELHMHVQANMKRRRKDEVLKELKPKTYTDVLLDLPKWQRDLYNKAHSDLIVELSEDKTLTVATALAKLTRLKQISVHPQATLKVESTKVPVKVEALLELLDDRPGKKTLIFTKYATVANELDTLLKKRKGLKVYTLTGAVPLDRRGDMEDEFQKLASSQEAVWISTIDAGGMGLTLTAADAVVFMDKDWVPAKNLQAEDRAHRIGQKDNVLVISLIARDTVEEKVEATLERKMGLINQIVEHDGGVDNIKITVEDIKSLLA